MGLLFNFITENKNMENKITTNYIKESLGLDMETIYKDKGFTKKEIIFMDFKTLPEELIYSFEEALGLVKKEKIGEYFPHFYNTENEPEIYGREAPIESLRYNTKRSLN